MVGRRPVTLLVAGVMTATLLASGPLMPVDFTTAESPCPGGALASEGSATVRPISVPKAATLTRSDFGAAVWRLRVPDATVRATDVDGCVRLTYELSVDSLGITSVSTETVHGESAEQRRLSLPTPSLRPGRVSEAQYDAEVRLIYHGMDNGTAVERTLATRTITVDVAA